MRLFLIIAENQNSLKTFKSLLFNSLGGTLSPFSSPLYIVVLKKVHILGKRRQRTPVGVRACAIAEVWKTLVFMGLLLASWPCWGPAVGGREGCSTSGMKTTNSTFHTITGRLDWDEKRFWVVYVLGRLAGNLAWRLKKILWLREHPPLPLPLGLARGQHLLKT